eukprot:TRINITY_DN6365_c0_g1_i2.p1 TRINITY_DN6365_c0_g1~~TRINITY_DN6365_c0_g1_i2.p1  ORF type:complete len:186 (+),score=35.12 TRINITY_DN6365_c0_g1_i2:80-637(+)
MTIVLEEGEIYESPADLDIRKEGEIDNGDNFSHCPTLCVHQILSMLNLKDLGNIQQVSVYWFHAARYNSAWKYALRTSCLSKCNTQEHGVKRLLMRLHSNLSKFEDWKKQAKEEFSTKQCKRCGGNYRELCNHYDACTYHPGLRVPGNSFPMSIESMCWNCCGQKSKTAFGCSKAAHVDEPFHFL